MVAIRFRAKDVDKAIGPHETEQNLTRSHKRTGLETFDGNEVSRRTAGGRTTQRDGEERNAAYHQRSIQHGRLFVSRQSRSSQGSEKRLARLVQCREV